MIVEKKLESEVHAVCGRKKSFQTGFVFYTCPLGLGQGNWSSEIKEKKKKKGRHEPAYASYLLLPMTAYDSSRQAFNFRKISFFFCYFHTMICCFFFFFYRPWQKEETDETYRTTINRFENEISRICCPRIHRHRLNRQESFIGQFTLTAHLRLHRH